MPSKRHRKGSKSNPHTPAAQCSTLLDDEMTRCPETPTHGRPVERCRVHHEQYLTMTKKYKEAQLIVDETLAGSLLPTKDEVLAYTSVPIILEKARLVKKYVNAIREERMGREIHHTRFFLKVDDGHKIRIKVLAKQMIDGLELRDALEARAMALHLQEHRAKDWIKEFQSTPLHGQDRGPLQPDSIFSAFILDSKPKERVPVKEEDDVIDLKLRHEREGYLRVFEMFIDPDKFWADYRRHTGQGPLPDTAQAKRTQIILSTAWLQYGRRVIFHDPYLFAKSLDKVSFKDFVMDDDFGPEDILRVMQLLSGRLQIGLLWWKDSLTEAIAIVDNPNGKFASANTGSLENRFKILGGWIYNNSQNKPASNEAWWMLLSADTPEKDTENRYVRLCCNFDELHTFLTFSAFVVEAPAPSFCTDKHDPSWNSIATRKHLSLCGVIITGMVGSMKIGGTMPIPVPPQRMGYLTWLEMETRAYIFGAIRTEPDEFTAAFLRELRARPDLFSLVTRSDTDAPRKLECFGNVTDQVRMRKFEAPIPRDGHPPPGRGDWQVMRSAMDVLYGGGNSKTPGYLSGEFSNRMETDGRQTSSFWYFKKFPVKYLLILHATPTGNVHQLTRLVAWAAFRAHGLVQGDYDGRKYDKASRVLCNKHAEERLSFFPGGGYKTWIRR
ncbi:hypothetical protein B0H10DRAFT_2176390 [Mycena sp. CBHHK59/15]|nr:hypothetical protein B0H10DRAFT_2176390 [Mycena sp. CBHHK59/15]